MGVPGCRIGWAAAQRQNEEEKRVRERGGQGRGAEGGQYAGSVLFLQAVKAEESKNRIKKKQNQ